MLSLIGDKMEVVVPVAPTGSSIDRNQRFTIPDTTGTLDSLASRLALRAIDQAQRGARAVAIGLPPSSLHDHPEKLLDPDPIALPGAVVDALVAAKVSHLLLLTKRRDEARAPFLNELQGIGRVQGLGFYVDPHYNVIRGDTREQVRGYIAPYAYLRVSLVDVASGKVVAQQPVAKMTTVPLSTAPNVNSPWDVLSPAQKLRALEDILSSELTLAVAKVLANN